MYRSGKMTDGQDTPSSSAKIASNLGQCWVRTLRKALSSTSCFLAKAARVMPRLYNSNLINSADHARSLEFLNFPERSLSDCFCTLFSRSFMTWGITLGVGKCQEFLPLSNQNSYLGHLLILCGRLSRTEISKLFLKTALSPSYSRGNQSSSETPSLVIRRILQPS